MKLRHIDLYLNPDEFSREYRSEFSFRTRFISNLIERKVRSIKYDTEYFNSICIQGRSNPEDVSPLKHEKSLVPEVYFDYNLFDSCSDEQLPEIVLEMMIKGFDTCSRFHLIPLKEIKEFIEEFRRENYKNTWVFKKKSFKDLKVKSQLYCAMDPHKFTLTLVLEKHNKTIFKENILQTKPSETIYAHQFKDIKISNGKLIVFDQFEKSLYELNLSDIDI